MQAGMQLELYYEDVGGPRAGLNGLKAPGKVVTGMPPKRLLQLRKVSHALF